MGKIKPPFTLTNVTEFIGRSLASAVKVKRAFSRNVLRFEDVYRRISDACLRVISYPVKKISQRQTGKTSVAARLSNSYSFSPKDISIFGADPNEVVKLKSTCKALGNIGHVLSEPNHYVKEKQSQVNALRSFLTALRSPSQEPGQKQYMLFLKLQHSVMQECEQIKYLLQNDLKKIKQQLKKMEPSTLQHVCSQDLHFIEDGFLRKLNDLPLHEFVKSAEYGKYQTIRHKMHLLQMQST